MEQQSGFVESRRPPAFYRGRHCHVAVVEEETFDTLPEKQSACEEVGNRGPLPDDAGGTIIRFPEDGHAPDPAHRR